MPLRAFSVFVAWCGARGLPGLALRLNALTGIQCIRSLVWGVARGCFFVGVLMPLRAFSVFVGQAREARKADGDGVLMPLRAFSVFVVRRRRRWARGRCRGLNALTGIQCIRRRTTRPPSPRSPEGLNALTGIQCIRRRY